MADHREWSRRPEENAIVFEVEGVPISQPRQMIDCRGKRPRTYLPDDHPIHSYKEAVALKAKEALPSRWDLTGPFEAWLLFVMPRLKKHKSGPMFLAPDLSEDIDNLEKAVWDALNKVVWLDDRQVVRVSKQRAVVESGKKPKLVVGARRLLNPFTVNLFPSFPEFSSKPST